MEGGEGCRKERGLRLTKDSALVTLWRVKDWGAGVDLNFLPPLPSPHEQLAGSQCRPHPALSLHDSLHQFHWELLAPWFQRSQLKINSSHAPARATQ